MNFLTPTTELHKELKYPPASILQFITENDELQGQETAY